MTTHLNSKGLEAAKPCPFCGSPPRIQEHDDGSYEIGCPSNWFGGDQKCNVGPAATGATKAEAIATWNRRSTSPAHTDDLGEPVAWHWWSRNSYSTWPTWVLGAERPDTAPAEAIALVPASALTELRARVEAAERERGEWEAACMQARDGCNQRSDVIRSLRASLAAAEALADAMREALEPFADFGEFMEVETEGFSDTDRLYLVPEESEVRLGDLFVAAFRRARASELASLKAKQGEATNG